MVVLIGLVATESTFSKPDERLRYAHGGCMSVWTILTLGGMFASRMMKHKGRLWIKIHAILMVTASVAGIGGILLGIMNGAHERSKWYRKDHFLIECVASARARARRGGVPRGRPRLTRRRPPSPARSPHRGIGYTVAVLMPLQLIGTIIWRPARTSPFRLLWNLWHHYQGRIMIGLSVCNVIIGLRIVAEIHNVSNGYTFLVAGIMAFEIFAFFFYGAILYMKSISIESFPYLQEGEEELEAIRGMDDMAMMGYGPGMGMGGGYGMPAYMGAGPMSPGMKPGLAMTPFSPNGARQPMPPSSMRFNGPMGSAPTSPGATSPKSSLRAVSSAMGAIRAMQAGAASGGRPPPFSPTTIKKPGPFSGIDRGSVL